MPETPSLMSWFSPFAILAYLIAIPALLISIAAYRHSGDEPPEERRWAQHTPKVVEPYTKLVTYIADTDTKSYVGAPVVYEFPNVSVYSTAAVETPPTPPTDPSTKPAPDTHISDGIEKSDPYRVDRVLVATVTKGLEAIPGDRLVWTRVLVRPINFHFAGFTVADTANKVLKVADVETSNDNKVDFDPGSSALAPLLKKVGATGTSETSRKASAEITEMVEDLGVDIQPDSLRIIRESGSGGDVMGNTRVKLSIVTDPALIHATAAIKTPPQPKEDLALFVSSVHLTDGANHLEAGKGASITVLPQNILPHCPLTARVWMIYEYRKIINGGDHHTEGLQDVDLIKGGEDVRDVEIVSADDIAPAVWSITDQQDKHILTAHARNDTALRLVFSDYVAASQLIHWLKVEGGPTQLSGLNFDIANPKDDLIPTKMTGSDCK